MLQVSNVRKEYKTNGFVQRALDGVSINFRNSEFVAILGPSGSGKTTLLNIIGGLDRYDDGDLIINGISTKQYRDKDWDSYRNHSIGFVFQNYNLIPHQNILTNVELSLTISGVSKRERKRRAKEALEQVGLEEHLYKLPNQLSGGQMQRVAIARALVNDPEILLADEPTGALDSVTSIQIMDLLKQVAKDRLVVMVTHNPELAQEYATRIIKLKDGKVISDSDPVPMEEFDEVVYRNMGKSSMSFLTALALSFKNLLTKKARTILVAIAGSIGIIGIALILSMSNGVNQYIADIEEDTLSEYPVELSKNSFSLTSFFDRITDTEKEEGVITELSLITNVFTKLSTNDLGAFRGYIEEDGSHFSPYARHIEYKYDITPVIFRADEAEARQVNPYDVMSIFDNDMMSLYSGLSSFTFSMTNVFHEMPSNEDLYKNQYQLAAGRWPEKYNECILVLTSGGAVGDLTLYATGLKDDTALRAAMEKYQRTGSMTMDTAGEEEQTYTYDQFLNRKFKLVNVADCYVYDKEYGIWTSKLSNEEYMKQVVEASEDITLVGIVKPIDDSNSAMLSIGINYPYALTEHLMQQAKDSPIVKEQLKTPSRDVLTGKEFASSENKLPDFSSLFEVDEEKMQKAFQINADALNGADMMPALSLEDVFAGMSLRDISFTDADMQRILSSLPEMNMSDADLAELSKNLPTLSADTLLELLKQVDFQMSTEDLRKAAEDIRNGYMAYVADNPQGDITKLPSGISAFLATDEAKAVLRQSLAEILATVADNLDTATISDTASAIAEGFPAWAEENGYNDIEHYTEDITAYLSSDTVLGIMREGLRSFLLNTAVNLSDSDMDQIAARLQEAYDTYAVSHAYPDTETIRQTLQNYLLSDGFAQIVRTDILDKIDMSRLQAQLQAKIAEMTKGYMQDIQSMIEKAMPGYAEKLMSVLFEILSDKIGAQLAPVAKQLENLLTNYMSNLFASMGDVKTLSQFFSFDLGMFQSAITLHMEQDDLAEFLTSILSASASTYEGNLKKFGYADENSPSSILIYPKSFDAKASVIAEIEAYNQKMVDVKEEAKVIEYTDMVGTLMSSITIIINAISYVLIAFVSISLVVSSIMIGVITYISVLERRKEIGILRSLGASKHNVSSVFNAETIITGFLAGVIGIGVTYLLLIPGNAILRAVTGQQNLVAFLPVKSAMILILLSVVLTLIGGLIPSRKAANSDPVTALRTE